MADGEEGPGRRIVAGTGEWEGWELIVGGDPYEDLSGPFYMRDNGDGTRRSAFRVETKHLNGGGAIHGGCLMTFADFALFMIAWKELEGVESVTVSLTGEFVGPAKLGDLVECAGEVIRSGRSMVFIRGLITCAGEPLLNFSGLVKKLRPRALDG
jgi:uncharacterized protein (TIGR00369 family)